MIITEAIQHVINGAVGANTVDKYGFPTGSRLADSNNSKLWSVPSEYGPPLLYWQFDEVFHDAKRQRGNFKDPTPYYIQQTKKRGVTGVPVQVTQNRYTSPLKTSLIGALDPRSGSVREFGFFPRLVGDAQALINNKILDAASQWSAAVDAVELGQTIGLFKDLSTRFLGITTGIIRRDPELILESFNLKPTKKLKRRTNRKLRQLAQQQGIQVGDAAAEFWLMYRYGINPLVYSLEDFRNALLSDYDPSFEAQVTVTRSLEYTPSGPYEIRHQSGAILYTLIERGAVRKSVRIKTTCSFRDSLKARIRGNPVAEALGTGWEYLPYSFIVDWVVGVGDYINQLNLPTLVANYSSVTTVKGLTRFSSHVNNIRKNPDNPDSQYIIRGRTDWASNETRSFERYLGSGIPLGNLMWGTGLSPTLRQLDAASLAFSKVRQLNSSTFH